MNSNQFYYHTTYRMMIHFVTFYFQPQGSNVTIMMYGITGLNPNNKYAVLIFLCMYVHRTFEHKKPNVILWKSLYKRKEVFFYCMIFYKKLLAFLDHRKEDLQPNLHSIGRMIVRSCQFVCDLWSGNTLSLNVVNAQFLNNPFWLLRNLYKKCFLKVHNSVILLYHPSSNLQTDSPVKLSEPIVCIIFFPWKSRKEKHST